MGGTGVNLNTAMPNTVTNDAMRRREGLFSWLQDSAPYGVITLDESLRIQGWNHWLELHSGRKAEEVSGQALLDLYPDIRERRLEGCLQRALQGEACVLSTSLHRHLLMFPSPFKTEGMEHMLQTARISPLMNSGIVCGVVIVIEDVTQRELQASALSKQHRRDELLSWTLAQLLQNDQPRRMVRQIFFKLAEQLDFDTFLVYLRDSQTGGLILDAAGGVSEKSEAALAQFPFKQILSGIPEETVVLNSISKETGPQYTALKDALIEAAVVAPLFSKERNLGFLCFAAWTRATIEPEDAGLVRTIAQYLATALDREFTRHQLQKAKEELGDHARLLEQKVHERTSRLQETVNELETFSYTIAHDLRAPARVTSGYVDILMEDFADILPADAKKILEKIIHTSRRMEMLTHDLLEFSKVSRQEILLSTVDMENVVDELLETQLPKAGSFVTVKRPLHKVRGHAGMLTHAISNLLDNAMKFVGPNKSPQISIYSELVPTGEPNTESPSLIFSSIPAEPEAGDGNDSARVRIWVCDSGIGIAPEAQRKIFSIFERAVTGELYHGTGIGLAIVARAMQRIGGSCGVKSTPGQGSCFFLEVPAA